MEPSLKHYGIEGMKWGIRRYRGSDGKVINKKLPPEKAAQLRKEGGSTPTSSPEHMETQALKKVPISQMTNAQLRVYVDRMNLEQQYKRLSTPQVSAGQKFVEKHLGSTMDTVAKTVLTIAVVQPLISLLRKKLSK